MKNYSFNQDLIDQLREFTDEQAERFPANEILRLDMHCHDYNSDKPEELLGRMLNVPETWLPSEDLLATLKKHGSTAFTITNHNNARSAWKLQEQGIDILAAA
ncbi:MAG: glycosyl transferase family 1, partial [Calditrichaeota bacterium]|nr:glycosyl transferase family 1 [Calditrichota bacterium]